MQESQVSRAVKLLEDIPELGLHSGEVGVVCSTWFEPTPAYEVEFSAAAGMSCTTRALLMANQIQDAELISAN